VKAFVQALAEGRVVAIATESFFGLLADVTSERALDRLFALKPRDAGKGVPLVLPEATAWSALVPEVPAAGQALAGAFWPGGLSIALPARPELDRRLVEGGRIAVRVPGPSPALELARAFGRPLTATSANQPGEPPATRAAAVTDSFPDAARAAELVVAPGESPGGAPSTVVVIDGSGAWLAREGRVPRASVQEILAREGVSLRAARGR